MCFNPEYAIDFLLYKPGDDKVCNRGTQFKVFIPT